MARKDTIQHKLNSTPQSLAASFLSPVTFIQHLDNCSYQINITTTNSIGTFKVQGSNDYTPNVVGNTVASSGTWVDLPLGGGTPNANAANDNIMIDLNQLPFNAIRLSYTAGTAGTGTCDMWLVCKQVGG